MMLTELHDHPSALVSYTLYLEGEDPQRQDISVRELAEIQLSDLETGEEGERELGGSCAPDLQRRIREELS